VIWVLAATVLPIDNWDGFEYLLNARRLAGHDVSYMKYGWVPLRPPLLSVLLAPVVAGYTPEGNPLVGPHLAMVAIGLGSLALVYRLLRESYPVAHSLAGVALLAVNPLVVHNTPFVYADVASMGLTALWRCGRRGSRRPWWCSASRCRSRSPDS